MFRRFQQHSKRHLRRCETHEGLVDAAPDSGFYHVRTEDDQVGWVSSKFVKLSANLAAPAAAEVVAPCDASLWTHVYHPNRLIVNQQCITVTGTIVDATNGKKHDGVRHEADGDTHGWLKVDAEFENLLNAGNKSQEGGNLVFEIVCKFPVTQSDAKTACQNYTDHVTIPAIGSHGEQWEPWFRTPFMPNGWKSTPLQASR